MRVEGQRISTQCSSGKVGTGLGRLYVRQPLRALVEVKIKKALEFVSGMGKPRACEGRRDVLFKFLPDIYEKRR